MVQVSLNNVSKFFPEGNVLAVDNLNLQVDHGEFVVLVGQSGCGKSTILRLIAGLEELSAGEIRINNRIVNHLPPKERDVAMVFQDYALYPHMTIYQNMGFGLKMQGYPKSEIKKRVEEAADILGLTSLLDRKPKTLSGGQRQRVAVGRAIVRQPKVFLFDEPLSNLDAKLRIQMRAELKKLHQRLKTTVIYVTHDQIEAMTMGTRIGLLKDGVLQQFDEPLRLYEQPLNRFVAEFIGSLPITLIDCSVLKQGQGFALKTPSFTLQAGAIKGLSDYINRGIVLGLRPEHIKCSLDDFTGVKARVEMVEPVGSEVHLYLKVGQNSLVSTIDSHLLGSLSEEIGLSFDLSKAHFFDPHSGQAIG